jgi:hypothetical protein
VYDDGDARSRVDDLIGVEPVLLRYPTSDGCPRSCIAPTMTG